MFFDKNYEVCNKYTWYDSNPDTNGGNAGEPGNGTDTEDFINELNSSNFGGSSDWRMPTPGELQSIVDYGKKYPAINNSYFSNTESASYWAATNYSIIYAWGMFFSDGRCSIEIKSDAYYVRAVRGGQSIIGSFDHLIANSDDTVTDTNTGLMWHIHFPSSFP